MLSPFDLPLFNLKEETKTSTHEVVKGTITVDGVKIIIEMVRSLKFPDNNFLIASIKTLDGQTLWFFKQEGWNGIAVLASCEEKIFIALLKSGRDGKVARVIALSDVVAKKKSSDIGAAIQAKKAVAQYLGRGYELSDSEQRVFTVLAERRRVELANLATAERKKNDEARRKRIEALLARPQVTGFTSQGRLCHGVPVVGEEWMSLPADTFVVRVESYDEASGKAGPLIEAFRVQKAPGKNPAKGFAAPVSAAVPTVVSETRQELPRKLKTVVVEQKDTGVFLEVDLYKSMEEVRQLRAAGLNGGTYVGFYVPHKNGEPTKVAVHQVFSDHVETMGHLVQI